MNKKTSGAQAKIMPPKKIILDGTGAIACGEYKAGTVYKVEGSEADRLLDVKGFRLATAGDEPKTSDAEKSNKKQEG